MSHNRWCISARPGKSIYIHKDVDVQYDNMLPFITVILRASLANTGHIRLIKMLAPLPTISRADGSLQK